MNHDDWIERNVAMKKVSQLLSCRYKDEDGKARKSNMEKTNQNYVIGGTERDHVHLNLKP